MPGLMERLQALGDCDATGTVPEGEGEERPHADGTAEDDVLLLGQPVQAEELADAGAIEADRAVPHDLAVSSKPVCSSRRVRPWRSRGPISSWSKSSGTRRGSASPGAHGRPLGRLVGIVGGPAAGPPAGWRALLGRSPADGTGCGDQDGPCSLPTSAIDGLRAVVTCADRYAPVIARVFLE